jgi:hypothetical protein
MHAGYDIDYVQIFPHNFFELINIIFDLLFKMKGAPVLRSQRHFPNSLADYILFSLLVDEHVEVTPNRENLFCKSAKY